MIKIDEVFESAMTVVWLACVEQQLANGEGLFLC
jgi:hypothetical protein